jgi:hypothetical protein
MTTKSYPVFFGGVSTGERSFNPYHWWSPRFWHGMRFGDWMKLWAGGRFRAHPARTYTVLTATLYTPLNTLLGWVQMLLYGKQLAQTKIEHPPVFIVGHWRSGTTFLHELMYLDERFCSPTTYQCFSPHHFLVSERILTRVFARMLPAHRPMDNVEVGWDRPQEDEFALLAMAAPTPYLRMAYPNDPPIYDEFLDMQGASPEDIKKFEGALTKFVGILTFHSKGRRVLLKSPPHTGRIETLARIFPGAKFVHITRDPYALFASTERLWDALDEAQGLLFPQDRDGSRREYVFHCLEKMYAAFERQRKQIAPNNICDVRYEDLVADPLKELARIYDQLDLGDFEPNRNKAAAWLDARKNYRMNKHELKDDLKAEIRRRWKIYFERYGYN